MKIITENYSKISSEVKNYVQSFFNDNTNNNFIYHNIVHTESVATAATQLANHYQLNERDFFVVITASWFHDVGYFTAIENHEEKSAAIAEIFLKGKRVDEETIVAVKECILATHIPQQPANLLEQIIYDADLFHLGTDEFSERNNLLRKEAEGLRGKKIKKKVWNSMTIKLMEEHHFFTDYCITLLNEKKKENLEKLKGKHHEEKDTHNEKIKKHNDKKNEDGLLSEVTKKDAPASRGIQTMFRITSGNNQKLSDMADNKAHIMISVNSIILSIILGVLFRKLDAGNSLIYPSILFIIVSLSTIIFSVLATRPSIPNGIFSEQDVTDKKVNLLFFGNFYKMNLEDYSAGMYKVMEDRNFLYGTLIKDVYSQGVVLGHKYRLLRISYNIFMYGLIASVSAFVVALLFFTPSPLQDALLNSTYKNPTGYDFSQPEKISLPNALNEVSGIAFNKSNADTIYAQQDEDSKLFHFKLGEKQEFVSKFGKHGDFEDIAICNGIVILLRSDGVFITFPLSEANQEELTGEKEWTALLPKGEYESIGAIDASGEFFVLCKHCKEKDRTKGYIFKLTDDGEIVSTGNFEINMDEIEERLDNQKIAFRPSGLALNTCTKEWYIISSVNKLLVVTDYNWTVKDVLQLNSSIFHQPEGIAFDSECNLYISNEKSTSSKASIMKFNYE